LESSDLQQTCALLEAELGLSPMSSGKKMVPRKNGQSDLPTRRDALRLGTRLAYIVPTVMTFSAQKAFAQASNPSGICSTGVATGELCTTDSDCCSGECSLGTCD
jgi:hypothetical protein